MRPKASELLHEAVQAWLCGTPTPGHVRLFDVVDLCEGAGTWGFTFQGKRHKLRPPERAPQIEVSFSPSGLHGRGEVSVYALGKPATMTGTICSDIISADIYVAAYFPEEEDKEVSFVLIAFDWVQECWAKVAWAVRVRPWILHWMEEVAKATEMRRIVAANLGSLEPDAIFSKET